MFLGHSVGFWIEVFVNGLSIGALYALFAFGPALLFGVARIINFAHGDFFMIGGYVTVFVVATLGWGYWGAVVAATLVLAIVGVGSHYAFFSRLRRRGSIEMAIIATLGLGIFLQNGARIIFGPDGKFVTTQYTGQSIELFGGDLQVLRLLLLVISFATLGALTIFFRKSRAGMAIRAVAQNPHAATIVGISPDRTTLIAVTLGLALSGLAAAALTPLVGVAPLIGALFVFKGFAIVVMGGFGNLPGTALAALMVGMTESVAGSLGSPAIQDGAAFLLMAIVLIIWPEGLVFQRVRAA